MRIKKILSVAVVLAMVMAVVPAFGLVASAAGGELVTLWNIAEHDVDGVVDVTEHALSKTAGVSLNKTNWNEKGEYVESGGTKTTLTFGEFYPFTNKALPDVMKFNDAYKTAEASKIVIEFAIAAKATNDNYGDLYFNDLDGNKFARFFYDFGSGTTDGNQNAECEAGLDKKQVVQAREPDGDHSSREKVLALRGVMFKVEADKTDTGYTVTYYQTKDADYQQIGDPETVESLNGIGSISYEFGGYSNADATTGLQGLKVSYVATEQSSEVTKKAALNSLNIVKQTDGTAVTLTKSITDAAGQELNITWSTNNESVISTDGTVTPVDQVAVVKLTATADSVSVEYPVTVFPKSRKSTTFAYGSGSDVAIYKLDDTNKVENGSFEGVDGSTLSLEGWMSAETADKTADNIEADQPLPSNSGDNSGAIVPVSFESSTVPDGKWAYGSRWNDGIGNGRRNDVDTAWTGNCNIQQFWQVSEEGDYYLSFYAKKRPGTNNQKIFVHFAEDETRTKNEPVSDVYKKSVGLHDEWERYEYIIHAPKAGYIVFTAYSMQAQSNEVPGTYLDNFELYTATKQEDTIKEIETVSVENGADKSALPSTLIATIESGGVTSKKEVTVTEWTKDGNFEYSGQGYETQQVSANIEGYGQNNVPVNVYHDFTVAEPIKTERGQDNAVNNSTKFPVAATKKVSATFDAVLNKYTDTSFGDLSIQFADTDKSHLNSNGGVELFSKGMQVGLGVNEAGSFRPVNGNGTGGRAEGYDPDKDLGFITAGVKYNFIVNIDLEAETAPKYTVAIYNSETGEEYKAENYGFRVNSDKLNAVYVFYNNEKGNRDSITIENLKVMYNEETPLPETYDVTANYYTSLDEPLGEPYYTVKRTAKPNSVLTYDAVSGIFADGAYYKADAQEITFDKTKTENIQLEKDANMPVASDMFSYGVYPSSDSTYKTEIQENTDGYRVANLTWYNVGIVVMAFDIPSGQKLEKATLNMYMTKFSNSGARQNIVYALDPEKVSFDPNALTNNVAGTDFSETNWALLTNAVEVYNKATTPQKEGLVEYDLDLSKINITGDKLILAFTNPTANEVSIAGLTYDNGNHPPYLTNITTATAPEGTVDAPTLGWQGDKFTINYPVENGKKVLIYHENPVTGALLPVTTESGVVTSSDGVAIATDNTNRIYAAAIYDAVAGTMSAKASIYSLVVDEIINNDYTAIDPEKLSKVNEVIANGGVYYDGELDTGTTLKDKTSSIMKVTAKNEVTIDEKLIKLNIGFVYNGGKLYVGTGDMTASELEGTYSKLTVDGSTVTLSGKIEDGVVTGQEAITLSLDSVNIEFIETLIEEAQADGADTEADFIPEL